LIAPLVTFMTCIYGYNPPNMCWGNSGQVSQILVIPKRQNQGIVLKACSLHDKKQ